MAAAILVTAATAAYGSAFAAPLLFPTAWVTLPCAIVLGPLSALLFRIAHDAGHNSLSASRKWNRIVGFCCTLPCYHPHCIWLLFHNKLHHGFTNLRDRDYIWIPLDKTEYDRLGPLRRACERFYRSAIGVGGYYCLVVWWQKMMRQPTRNLAVRRIAAMRDRVAVCLFLSMQLGTIAMSGASLAGVAFDAALLILIPFLLFCWMVGYVSFFNHTHPRVPWFARAAEWSFFDGQLNCTVHMPVPWWLTLFRTDLGQHGTHHFHPGIPIGRLPAANRIVERAFPERLIVEPWSFRSQAAILRRCKLYDYDGHQWLDFSGRPTAPAIGLD